MSPEFKRELDGLSEQEARVVVHLALDRLVGPVAKVRTVQRWLCAFLGTGWPEDPKVAQVLREIRGDIGLRLEPQEVRT